MVKGLYTAYTGMVNEMKRLDVLANNLANANTYGYKKEGTTSHSFEEEMALRVKDTSVYDIPDKIGNITYGVHLGETYTDWDSGSFKVTDQTTDFAIAGKGFFAIAFTSVISVLSYLGLLFVFGILDINIIKDYLLHKFKSKTNSNCQ